MEKRYATFSKIGIGVAAVVVIGGGIYAATQKSSTKSTDKYAVALVTDGGGIDDRSFNQSAWEGLKAYGKANNLEQGKVVIIIS